MDKADAHLESMLEDLNDKVSDLEDHGDPHELLQAYVNRGRVLSMLGYRTSAMEDLESASDLYDSLPDGDAGTYVRIHSSIASILFDQGDDPVEEYWNASTRLREVGPGSVQFDYRSLAKLCISAAEDLLDSGHPDDTDAWTDKGLEVLNGSDQWTRNRRVDLWNLAGEAADCCNDPARAIDVYSHAVDEGVSLMEDGVLEDTATVVLALSMRASAETDLKRDDDAVRDLDASVALLEGLLEHHGLPDTEPLVELHHDLASALVKVGKVEEAERHLIRAMELGISRSISDDPQRPVRSAEDVLQSTVVAAQRERAGPVHLLARDPAEVDVVTGFLCKLPDEDPLRAPVALAERVHRIDPAHVIG